MANNPQKLRINSKPWPGYVAPKQLSTRDTDRLDNKIKQRAVIGWVLVGSSYKNGRKIPGEVRLMLEGGGWMWFPEDTPIDEALKQADDHGFNVNQAREDLDEWIRTGEGATFSLE